MPLTFIRGILANELSSSKPDSEGKALPKAVQTPNQDLSEISNRASVLENQNAAGTRISQLNPVRHLLDFLVFLFLVYFFTFFYSDLSEAK